MNGSEDPNDEAQYHLEVGPVDLADTASLPGDPERVDRVMALWNDHEEKASHREHRTTIGSYSGTPIPTTSTGIGSPSAAITVGELAHVGANTFIHVGSCGVIQPEMDVGDPVIASDVVRQEGTSKEYTRGDYPAVANHEIVSMLVVATEQLGYDYHVGLTMSADSLRVRQGRPGPEGLRTTSPDSLARRLREASVKNIEIETAALLTIANVYGLRAGVVCSVYTNRVTGEFRTEGGSCAAETASLAIHLLVKVDEVRRETGVGRWYAGFSLD